MATDQLTTLNNVKAYIGIGDTKEDARIRFLINFASGLITNYCNRPFWLADNEMNPLTELLSGQGDQWLMLKYWPVRSITSIYADDSAYWGASSNPYASSTLLTQGTDYALAVDTIYGTSKRAMILRINGVWDTTFMRDGGMLASYIDTGLGNIKVTYTYGFNSLPDDIVGAATVVVARMRNSTQFGQAITSEHYEEYSYTLAENKDSDKYGLGYLGGDISTILAQYTIMSFGAQH